MTSDLTTLLPRQPVPPLAVALVGGGRFQLSEERPATFTLIVFYRGATAQFAAATSSRSRRVWTTSQHAG